MKIKNYVDRIISLCYDYIFVILSILIIYLVLNYWLKVDMWLIIVWSIIFYLILYPLICLLLKGSVGKALNDLYIEPTNGKITYGRILFREVIMKQLLYLTILGLIWEIIFFIVKKETLHDYYLKTVVKKIENKKGS